MAREHENGGQQPYRVTRHVTESRDSLQRWSSVREPRGQGSEGRRAVRRCALPLRSSAGNPACATAAPAAFTLLAVRVHDADHVELIRRRPVAGDLATARLLALREYLELARRTAGVDVQLIDERTGALVLSVAAAGGA